MLNLRFRNQHRPKEKGRSQDGSRIFEDFQAAFMGVERVLDGVNAHVEHFEPEEPLPSPTDILTDEMANLVVTLNSDTAAIQAKQIKFQKNLQNSESANRDGFKASLLFDYKSQDWNWQNFNFSREIPNPNFIFHNKLPKSGIELNKFRYFNKLLNLLILLFSIK